MTTKVVQCVSLSCLNMFRQLKQPESWNERKQCLGERNALNLGRWALILLTFSLRNQPKTIAHLDYPLPESVSGQVFLQAYSSEVTFHPTFPIMYIIWRSPKPLWGLTLHICFKKLRHTNCLRFLLPGVTLGVGFRDGFSEFIPRCTIGQSMAAEADSKALVSPAVFLILLGT